MPLEDGSLVSIDLSKERRTALMQQVRDHVEEAESARGDWPTRHERRYRRYLADQSLRGRGPYLNSARVFTTDTQNVVERLLAEISTGMLPNMEAIEFEPFDAAALPNLEKALRTEHWALRYLINDADKGGIAYIIETLVMDALLDSAGFLKVYPWRQPWRDAKPERLIRMDNVDEGTLLIPPGATGTQYPDAAYIGQDLYVRWDDLLRMKKEGFHVAAKDKMVTEPKHLTERQRAEEEREGRSPGTQDGWYRVCEMYERFVVDPKKDDEEDEVIVSFYPNNEGDDALARVIYLTDRFPSVDHPRRPFFSLALWMQPRQLRGLNIPDKIEIWQDLVNRATEQSIWYGDISILPFFLYNAMISGDLPDLTQIMPGQGVPVNDLSGIQFVPRGSMNQHFQQQFSWFGAQIEKTSKVGDLTLGAQPTRPNAPRTAAGTAMILQQGREAKSALVKFGGLQLQAPLQFHWQLQQYYVPVGLQVPMTRATRQWSGFGPPPPRPAPATAGALTAPERLLPSPATNGLAPPPSPAGAPGPARPPDSIDALMHPEHEYLLAEEVKADDLKGTFLVKLKVNPDLPFDRQVVTQLGNFFFPILDGVYPLGARLLLKRIWEVNSQHGFEQLYPEPIALLKTQALFAQAMQALKAQDAANQPPPSPPQEPPGPGESPAARGMAERHAVSESQHGMAQHEIATMTQQAKLLKELQALLAAHNGATNERE